MEKWGEIFGKGKEHLTVAVIPAQAGIQGGEEWVSGSED
jgi:hypothetical protein